MRVNKAPNMCSHWLRATLGTCNHAELLLLSVSQFLLPYLSINLINLCLLSQGQRKEEMELARIEIKGNEKGKKSKLGYFLNLLYTMTLNTMQLKTKRVLERLRINTIKTKEKNPLQIKYFSKPCGQITL